MKDKLAIPLQAWRGPYSCRWLKLPEFLDSWHMKVLKLSAIGTGLLYPPPEGDIPGTHFG